eukprot:3591652-Rhodomonas_salina.1
MRAAPNLNRGTARGYPGVPGYPGPWAAGEARAVPGYPGNPGPVSTGINFRSSVSSEKCFEFLMRGRPSLTLN